MILTALEMQGFKSFPEKTTLNFGKGITAVVGPNGSGKSNISDAVRWVLGEQSSKSLRGSKMEDVIFDGTKVRKAYGYAQVTLRLDNKDRSLKTYDTDEVSVTRRYYRSGESEYKINGAAVRLRDVHELFMDTGLGRDGYSMVSQGKIADMVSGKGKECREMLEEAAGISSYRYRRNDSLKKLSQAEENLIRLRDILSELEGRIGPLKHQSEKAEKFLVYAEEKKNLEIGLWLYNIDRLRDSLRKQEDNIAVASGHYSEVEKELSEIEEMIEESVRSTQNINIEIDEIRNHISELEEQAANAGSQQAVLKSSIEHNRDTIDRIEKSRFDSESDKKELLKEIETEEKLISQIAKIKAEKAEKLASVNAELEKMKLSGGELQQEKDKISGEISALTALLADYRVKVSTALSSKNEILSRKETVDGLIEQKRLAVDSFLIRKNDAEKAVTASEKEITEISNSLSGYNLRFTQKDEKADKLKKELDEKSFDCQRVSSKAKMLIELEKNMEGYSGAVRKIIREGEKGALKGIHGTVSQLISVKGEYAVAIETAFGNAIQNIVTDTENDAKAAINFLKNANLGRATFQPISAIKGKTLEEKGLDDCYGYVDMAVNLVTYDGIYHEIITSLIGKTVVAEDLTSAIAIAKRYNHKFKIVTLDGQVINPGGSMTGGSQDKSAGILSRGTEIEELKKKHADLEASVKSLNDDYDRIVEELNAIERESECLKQSLSAAQEEKIRLEGEYNLAFQQYTSARLDLEELEKEKNDADERLKEIEQAYTASEKAIADFNNKIGLSEQSLRALSEKSVEISEKSEEFASVISKLSLEIHGADKDLQARNQALNLLKARLLSHENKEVELDSEIEAIKQKNAEIEKQISELSQLSLSLDGKRKQANDDIAALQKKRSGEEEKSSALRVSERNKTSEREKISGELARLEERKEAMQQDYLNTENKLFDEYQLTRREAEASVEKPDEPRLAQRSLNEIKGKIRALGSVNVGAIEEYKEVKERYEFMNEQVGDVEKSKKELTRLITELTDKMSCQFREQFNKINLNFNDTFRELFGGGKAELIIEDPTDILESNIDIKLQPPGKNVKRLDSLSGGEKGLSAIALLFAIMKVNPAPFCIFDEVEAALDDVNVTRYAQYVRKMTDNTQFILITHRRGTMEEADMLYGITMQEQGVSKLLELKTAELAKQLGITG
ncbi:MAG: chromosome segregation protein SMC [Ruminococcaceae bacterium]|nr:chromosome segregation protein SMC [Oscillospiraceae bacterium]